MVKSPRTLKHKYHIPEDETPSLRDQRTIFVGNLLIELASKKPLSKQLQRHILTLVPTAKIESIRFRSIPFQAPTSKLPTSDDEGDSNNTKTKLKPQTPKKEVRPHDRERTSIWRSKAVDEEEAVVKKDEKKYITPSQKKKIAFINQEFHSTADTVNAYIVFAHPTNTENRPSNLPPIPLTLDPYEAARLAAERCDGTLFMERMIRVDLVGKDNNAGSTLTSNSEKKSALIDTDPKLSVFVGNLDFASKEEDLRAFFEGLMASEKGIPQAHNDTDEEGSRKPLAWVTRVRIVRDRDTQLGKGFAYVQFTDRACVDELLALEETKLKFAKRKLRVQRCKTLPGSKLPDTAAPKSKKRDPTTVIIPKGDPFLGEKLAGLSKDERKQRKSTDADRVARRLAKKKARMALASSVGIVKSQGKDRERARKTTGQRKPSGGKKDSKSRGRIRSAESVAKKNTKK
ncbi:hypothetical protein BYT27DRAFT_7227870 [Phlegmacium glaucopus]|nr:hypothetical protein BYT27DRAFT_7227870 [Phlegmacium glaucopus]